MYVFICYVIQPTSVKKWSINLYTKTDWKIINTLKTSERRGYQMKTRVVKIASVIVVALLVSVVFQVMLQNEMKETQSSFIPIGQYVYNMTSSSTDSKWQAVKIDALNNIHMVSVHEDASGDYEIYYSMFDSMYNVMINDEQLTNNSYDDVMPSMDIDDSPPTSVILHLVWTSLQDHDLEYAKVTVNLGTFTVDGNVQSTLRDTDNQTWVIEPKIVLEDSDEFHVAWTEGDSELQIDDCSVKYMWVQDQGQLNKTTLNITDPLQDIVARSPSITFHDQSAKMVWSEYFGGHTYLRFTSIDDGQRSNNATLKSIPDGQNLTIYFPYVVSGTEIASEYYPLIETDIIADNNNFLHIVYCYHYKKIGYIIASPVGVVHSDVQLTSTIFDIYYSYHPTIVVGTNYRSYISWGSGTLNNSWLPRESREIYMSKFNYMNVLTTGVEEDINGLCVVDDLTIPWNTNQYDNDTFKVGVPGYIFSPDYDHYPIITINVDETTMIVYSNNESSEMMFLKTNIDQDYDGMADWWEMKYFNTIGHQPEMDIDNDGLSNLLEYNSETLAQAGSDPSDSDTDDDTIDDNDEISDANDKVATNPRNCDTDGDGLNDSDEQGATPENGFLTNPLHFDTDGDGLWDGSRDLDNDGHDIDDPGEDVDLDGEIDGDTNQNGTWEPGENWTETDPNNNDTDDDGIYDGHFYGYVYDGLFFLTSNWGWYGQYVPWNYSGGALGRGEMAYPWKSIWDINATDWDTDDDGICDGNETMAFSDIDGDGLINAQDFESDGDLLYDSLEMGLTTNDNSNYMGVISNESQTTFIADGDPNTTTDMSNPDSDFDGLFDGCNDKNGNDVCNLGEGGEDRDLDGIWDVNETDPTYYDTDNDGLADGRKGQFTVNSTIYYIGEDVDLDGIIDSNETDPFDWDSDDDGLKDGHQYEGCVDTDEDGKINAMDIDSDADTIRDSVETGKTTSTVFATIQFHNRTYDATDTTSEWFAEDYDPETTTNPLSNDTDGDQLLDGDEDGNQNGKWNYWETNSTNEDTDYDGLWDGFEDYDGDKEYDEGEPGEDIDLDQTVDDGETDPRDADCDDDGIPDGHWYEGFVDTDDDTIPNCFDSDSDGDNVNDSVEFGVTIATAIEPIIKNNNTFVFGTDLTNLEIDKDYGNTTTSPIEIDSDHDGLPDGWIDGWGYNVSNEQWGVLWNFSSSSPGYNDGDINNTCDWNDDGVIDFYFAEYEDWNGDGKVKGDTDNDGIIDGFLEFKQENYILLPNGSNYELPHLVLDSSTTETWLNTNPCSNWISFDTGYITGYDSDCDGISDGDEIVTDLLSNLTGKQSTNPLDHDSDNDLLWDGVGITIFVSEFNLTYTNGGEKQTNPYLKDSDADGLWDGFKDLDDDNVYDSNEFGEDTNLNGDPIEIWSWTNLYGSETNPVLNDTDLDGLLDGVEVGVQGYDSDSGATTTCPFDIDSDDDGLPDGWIDGWNQTICDNTGIQLGSLLGWGLTNESDDIQQAWEGEDFDGDGVRDTGSWTPEPDQNGYHSGAETNATNNDTDEDKIPDYWEVVHSVMNPTYYNDRSADPDSDNLKNYGEYILGYDPSNAHTIDSEIEDGSLSFDYDDDGLPNVWEAEHELNYTDGTDYDDDPDEDGLTNLEEYRYGAAFWYPSGKWWDGNYNNWTKTYRRGKFIEIYWEKDRVKRNDTYWGGLDPNNWDTDNDKILDGKEDKNQNSRWDYSNGETSATNKDSDYDGFNDTVETYGDIYTINNSLTSTYMYTDPLDYDTDDDTCPDGYDFDPLVDQIITLNISEILALDSIDTDSNQADFKVKVVFWTDDINETDGTKFYWGEDSDSRTNYNGSEWDNDDHKTPDEIGDQLTFEYDIPDDDENIIGSNQNDYSNPIVHISIELIDDWTTSKTKDRTLDICGKLTAGKSPWGRNLYLNYYPKQGGWASNYYYESNNTISGGNYYYDTALPPVTHDTKGPNNVNEIEKDETGPGHSRGDEGPDSNESFNTIHGSRSTNEFDAAIWFNISQLDYDGDGLTYYQEMNWYNTNATDIDSDDDGLYDREIFYKDDDGFDPLKEEDISKYMHNKSWDNDTLTNSFEINTLYIGPFGTNPTIDDTDQDGVWDDYEVESMIHLHPISDDWNELFYLYQILSNFAGEQSTVLEQMITMLDISTEDVEDEKVDVQDVIDKGLDILHQHWTFIADEFYGVYIGALIDLIPFDHIWMPFAEYIFGEYIPGSATVRQIKEEASKLGDMTANVFHSVDYPDCYNLGHAVALDNIDDSDYGNNLLFGTLTKPGLISSLGSINALLEDIMIILDCFVNNSSPIYDIQNDNSWDSYDENNDKLLDFYDVNEKMKDINLIFGTVSDCNATDYPRAYTINKSAITNSTHIEHLTFPDYSLEEKVRKLGHVIGKLLKTRGFDPIGQVHYEYTDFISAYERENDITSSAIDYGPDYYEIALPISFTLFNVANELKIIRGFLDYWYLG